MQWMAFINVGKQLLFQSLTSPPCILSCHIINFWWCIVWFGGESKYITVNSYGALWVKNIIDNVTPNKGCSCLST